MNKTITQFEVSSPTELQEALVVEEQENDVCFATARVFGPQILTRPFSFPKVSSRELPSGLRLEVAEVFSMTAQEIELSYQVINKDEENIKGVYSAMPRKLLLEYLDCFKASPLIPISLTASAISVPLEFIKQQPSLGDNCLVINFLRPKMVSIAVFAEGIPMLFHEELDISDEDIENKIQNTVRYICSQTQAKKINHIFFTGDLRGKEPLIQKIKTLEALKNSDSPLQESSVKSTNLIAPNLLEKYVLNEQQRSYLISLFSMILIGFGIIAVLLAAHLFIGHTNLQRVKTTINMNEYQKALVLQKQIKRMEHAQ